jgi:hypothetical protein
MDFTGNVFPVEHTKKSDNCVEMKQKVTYYTIHGIFLYVTKREMKNNNVVMSPESHKQKYTQATVDNRFTRSRKSYRHTVNLGGK